MTGIDLMMIELAIGERAVFIALNPAEKKTFLFLEAGFEVKRKYSLHGIKYQCKRYTKLTNNLHIQHFVTTLYTVSVP